MSQRVFLHVGLPKSGTTYVQSVLSANKQRLMESAGLLYPGEQWRQQVAAVRDVRKMYAGPRKRQVAGAWPRLVDEMGAWSGDCVVSMEWLCSAQPDQIRRIVADLAPASVEVVFTVRDLGRTIPAAWQEGVQNRKDWSWTEFLDGVMADEPLSTFPGKRFWGFQDVVGMLASWSRSIPRERLHVVTVPQRGAGRDVLWNRMCAVLGIDAAGYALDGLKSNVSLGTDSVELLRRLNPRARAGGIEKSTYQREFTRGLAKRGLARREASSGRLGLPADRHRWVVARAEADRRAIEAAGVHVVGDLDELRPVLPDDPGRQPDDFSDEELLEVALEALVILAREHDSKRVARRRDRRTSKTQARRRGKPRRHRDKGET